jgi:hypothetical protein
MNTLAFSPRESESRKNNAGREPELTAEERRRIALASLELFEREHLLRVARIRAERRALLARAS